MKNAFAFLVAGAFALSIGSSLAVADNNSEKSVRNCGETGLNPGQALQLLTSGPAAGKDRIQTPPVAFESEFDTVGEAIKDSCLNELPS